MMSRTTGVYRQYVSIENVHAERGSIQIIFLFEHPFERKSSGGRMNTSVMEKRWEPVVKDRTNEHSGTKS